jgi:hypothetical protein
MSVYDSMNGCRAIDIRAAVLRPESIEKLTSALAIFGESLSIEFPELTSTAELERHLVEAFMTWTATRPGRWQPGPRPPGRPVHHRARRHHAADLPERHRRLGLGPVATATAGVPHPTSPTNPNCCLVRCQPMSTPP